MTYNVFGGTLNLAQFNSIRNATKFCMVRGLANGHISPSVVNFDSGVRRCHVATCISPSLTSSSIYDVLILYR